MKKIVLVVALLLSAAAVSFVASGIGVVSAAHAGGNNCSNCWQEISDEKDYRIGVPWLGARYRHRDHDDDCRSTRVGLRW
jgi:hypothetical protein